VEKSVLYRAEYGPISKIFNPLNLAIIYCFEFFEYLIDSQVSWKFLKDHSELIQVP